MEEGLGRAARELVFIFTSRPPPLFERLEQARDNVTQI